MKESKRLERVRLLDTVRVVAAAGDRATARSILATFFAMAIEHSGGDPKLTAAIATVMQA